jgi:hypothetical protein
VRGDSSVIQVNCEAQEERIINSYKRFGGIPELLGLVSCIAMLTGYNCCDTSYSRRYLRAVLEVYPFSSVVGKDLWAYPEHTHKIKFFL